MGITRITTKSGKVKYKAKVYLGIDSNGREFRKSKTFDRKKDASNWSNKMHKKKGVEINTNAQALSKVVIPYFEMLVSTRKGNTIRAYRQNFNNWILPYFGFTKVNKITSSMVEEYLQALLKDGASSGTVKITLNRLRNFLDWCIKKNYISSNPALSVEPPKPTPKPRRINYHQASEVFQLLDYMNESDYKSLVIFLYSTGLRISEACALRVEDIDVRNSIIHVNRNLTPYQPQDHEPIIEGAFYLDSTKNEGERSLPMNDELLGIMREICQGKRKGEFLFQTKKGKLRTVVIQRGRKPILKEARIINPQDFTNSIFKPFQKRAGLSNVIGSHGTRHTFASHYMMNGGDVFTLQKLLGHKSIKSTMVYAHLSPDHLEKSRNLVNFKQKSEPFRNLISIRSKIK